jgi:CheY-like chemotaxis protein
MSSEPRFGLTTADGRRPRVLVVDGNAASSMVTVALARQFGCMPVAAAGGEAALSLLRRDGGIDLIVLDMGLADREGMVLAQLVRTLGERGAMPIVALVSGQRLPGKAAGISAALRKPYSPRELYGAMRDGLARVSAALSSAA